MMLEFIQQRGAWHAQNIHTNEHIGVGHDEYLDTNFVYNQELPLDNTKARKLRGLIAERGKIIIRPRNDNKDMESYDKNHWGTLYDVTAANFSPNGISLQLANPIYLAKPKLKD